MQHYIRNIAKQFLQLITVSLLFSWPLLSHSAGMPVIDVVNWSENVVIAKKAADSLIQQAKQLKNQIEMIKNQKEQLKALAHYDWRDASSLLKELDNIQRQSNALSYGIDDWQRQFNHLYRDFNQTNQKLVDSFSAVQQQQKATLATLENALAVSHAAADNAQDEQQFLKDINKQANHAINPLQASQAQAALQSENIQQLQTIKRLLLAQMNMQEAIMASSVSQQSTQDEALHKMINSMPTEFPQYRENPNFGKIRFSNNH